jgi:hypothetical protein
MNITLPRLARCDIRRATQTSGANHSARLEHFTHRPAGDGISGRTIPWHHEAGIQPDKDGFPVTLQAPLWRAIAVFRFASLAYAAVLVALHSSEYARLGWAWVVLAGMPAWTVVTTVAYSKPARRTRALLVADLLVAAARAAVHGAPAVSPQRRRGGHADHRDLGGRAGTSLGGGRGDPGRRCGGRRPRRL